MTALEENDDAMTASFSASTFEAEENDPWTPQGLGSGPVDAILGKRHPPSTQSLLALPQKSLLREHPSFFFVQRGSHFLRFIQRRLTWLSRQEARLAYQQ